MDNSEIFQPIFLQSKYNEVSVQTFYTIYSPSKKLVETPVINFMLIEVPSKYLVVQHPSSYYMGSNLRGITFFK